MDTTHSEVAPGQIELLIISNFGRVHIPDSIKIPHFQQPFGPVFSLIFNPAVLQ